MNRYQGMFSGVQSLWAYHDSSPGTWTGALDHIEAWEKSTEPGKDPAKVDPELAKGSRKAANVSTWNTQDGYQGGKPMSFYDIRTALDAQENMFQNFYSGKEAVESPQTGPLREHYALVQRAINHPDAPSEYRTRMLQRRDVTIRLLYYQLVCQKFQGHHSQTLQRDYEAAGMDKPDFSSMSRAEILAHIEELRQKASGSDALRLVEQGLGALDSEIIPTSWV